MARWANFVVGTGLAFTLDEYLALPRLAREAAIAEHNRMNAKG